MFLPASHLESVLLKRIEQLQGLPSAPALGLSHCLARCTQAHTSAAGLEWSSTDEHDGHQENIQLEFTEAALSAQLGAWETWLAAGGVVAKAQYLAATHALVKDILSCIIVGSEPAVSRNAVDAAWEEDAGSGSDTLSADRFKSSLAALATACSSDSAAQTAAACLASLLAKIQEQQQRWQGLLEQYSAEMQPGSDGLAAETGAASAEAAGGPTAAAAAPAAPAVDGDDSGDLDALLGEEDGEARDVAPASDKSPEAEAAAGSADGANAAAQAEDDDDGFSLGLSRATSHTSNASSQDSDAAAATNATAGASGGDRAAAADAKGAPARRAAQRGLSVKSIEDPELRRALSETSSADLDELPPDDLDAAMQRQGSHAKASTRRAKQAAAAAAGGGIGSVEAGRGHLADLDLKAWAELKDKQQRTLPPALAQQQQQQRGRGAPGPAPGSAAQAAGRGDAGKQALDQHLKGVRGPQAAGPAAAPGGNLLHTALFNGNPARQSMERQSVDRGSVGLGGAGSGMSRHGSNGSNETPARMRTLAANVSRKLSISEPGPMGQQAEWRHLPALGQASRLHPHEGRQPSYGRTAAPSRGRPDPAALVEDKLPALPALTGARGQPPKAMELLRRPSVGQRSDAHHADFGNQAAPNAHLPGLGPSGKQGPQGARALYVQPKRSFRGDGNF